MITLSAKITIDRKPITLDYKRIVSINASIFDRSDMQKPSYGIISNSGQMEFIDYNNQFLNYANEGLLRPDLKATIFLSNTNANIQKQIAEFKTASWDYDNKYVRVSLKDDLEEWQDINIGGIDYDPRNLVEQNLKYYYDFLFEKTPSKYNMIAFDELNASTKDILSNTYIKYTLLKSGSLWAQWTKLCKVSQSHIYKNNEGKTIFVYNGGN
jgi:hypothetical protein